MASTPENIFIFDMMRNRSHVFFRYLGNHPSIQSIWHPFLPAFLFGPERIFQYTKNFDEDGNDMGSLPLAGPSTYADVTKDYLRAIKDAQDKGKIPVANEHTQNVFKQEISLAFIRNEPIDDSAWSNPTVIPDHIYAILTPIFVIRNPVHALPSNYISCKETSPVRPGGEDWKLLTGVPLQRRLFDHFRDRNGTPPIVVDGDDVLWRTEGVRQKLSKALHLDPEGLSDVWEPVPENERSESSFIRYWLQTIDDSRGIQRPSTQPPDAELNAAHGRWADKFGQKVADQLRSSAEEIMPHYEYMKQFKI